MGNADKKTKVESYLVQRREREKILALAAGKEVEADEPVKIFDPIEDGKLADKKRAFMDNLRPDQRCWNFEIDEEESKVDHVLRVGADPRKSYIDGRIEKLLDKVEKMGTHLRVYQEQRWTMLNQLTWEIFESQEKELESA